MEQVVRLSERLEEMKKEREAVERDLVQKIQARKDDHDKMIEGMVD